MHFEILVEGQCELTALSVLMPKIVGKYKEPHTWKIHKHRGIGRLPDNPAGKPNVHDPTLLHNLPSKLRAYGKDRKKEFTVVVLVDLDDRPNSLEFTETLVGMLEFCNEKPKALFLVAVEELEAWYMGDLAAIKQAYPDCKLNVLENYVQDMQCGTWEKLADAIFPEESAVLKDAIRDLF